MATASKFETTLKITELIKNNVKRLQRLNVVYADGGLLVLNKPRGLVTQGTVVIHGAQGGFQRLLQAIQLTLGLPYTPFPVHRLDKNTTGGLILALTKKQSKILSEQFNPSTAKYGATKEYFALVSLSSRMDSSEFDTKYRTTVKAPLFQLVQPGTRYDGLMDLLDANHKVEKGKVIPATTVFTPLAISPTGRTGLVHCQLLSGAKHQIRLHLARYLKSPIIGDTQYGSPATNNASLCLHSHRTSLVRFKSHVGNFPKSGPQPTSLSIQILPPASFVDLCQQQDILIPQNLSEGKVFLNAQDMTTILSDPYASRLSQWEGYSMLGGEYAETSEELDARVQEVLQESRV